MNTVIAQQITELGGVEAYLHAQQHKTLLRFLTCGSVDDGKSTLIGRLLHDTRQIYEDQLSTLHTDSKRIGTQGDKLDLALLVDGLQAEREQGITIDVAYRYFSTEKRKFIIADTPGHEQYTRNMATGASASDVAVVLIDARKGVLDQTRRHSFIASLLGIRHLIIAVNKMDLVAYQQEVFESIQQDYLALSASLPGSPQLNFIPLSALDGDNIVRVSENMPWYQGPTLLALLEHIDVQDSLNQRPLRFPVQYVNRPDLDFRGYAGTVSTGVLTLGQKIKVLPSGVQSEVRRIVTFEGDRDSAYAGEAITIVLQHEVDISRGDLVVSVNDPLGVARSAVLDVVWMSEMPLTAGQRYGIKVAGKKTQGHIDHIEHQIEINTLQTHRTSQLGLNGIGRVTITFDEPLVLDPYLTNRDTGGLILIDLLSNVTVGAGLVQEIVPLDNTTMSSHAAYSNFELELNALIRRHFPHWQAKNLLAGDDK